MAPVRWPGSPLAISWWVRIPPKAKDFYFIIDSYQYHPSTLTFSSKHRNHQKNRFVIVFIFCLNRELLLLPLPLFFLFSFKKVESKILSFKNEGLVERRKKEEKRRFCLWPKLSCQPKIFGGRKNCFTHLLRFRVRFHAAPPWPKSRENATD